MPTVDLTTPPESDRLIDAIVAFIREPDTVNAVATRMGYSQPALLRGLRKYCPHFEQIRAYSVLHPGLPIPHTLVPAWLGGTAKFAQVPERQSR